MQSLLATFELHAPDETIYRSALTRCTLVGVGSGAVFDALHMATAEHRGADLVLTFNASDFTRLAAAGSPRVLVPPDPPGVVW